MISLGMLLILSCLGFSTNLIVNFLQGRNNLYRRIVGLSPAAGLINQRQSRVRRVRSLSKQGREAVDAELIDLLDMISVVLASGQSLFGALARVASLSSAGLAGELRGVIQRVELGSQISTELSGLAQRLPTPAIREFVGKLNLALTRGTPLSLALANLAKSLRANHGAELLRKAGANETKMLIPVVLLICPLTIVFALLPSAQYLSLI